MRKIIRKGICLIMTALMIIPYTCMASAEELPAEIMNDSDAQVIQEQPDPPQSDAESSADTLSVAETEQDTDTYVTEQPQCIPDSEPEAAVTDPQPAGSAETEHQTSGMPDDAGTAVTDSVSDRAASAESVCGEQEDETETISSAAAPSYGSVSEDVSDSENPAPAEYDTAASVSANMSFSSAEAGMASASAASSKKSITIAGTTLDKDKSNSGSGWSYDNESDTILLRNFSGRKDITSDGTGVKIVTSGLNRIGKLSVDGQIDLIGSGILLVDEIELAKGCDFNLLPVKEMYGENGGGAAVFLRQKDGTYRLINGRVSGVIDETIVINDGTTLVIPAESTLELKALGRRTTIDEDGNILSDEYFSQPEEFNESEDNAKYYAGKLEVSNLIIEAGASVINNALGEYAAGGVTVYDRLVNNGTVTGGTIDINGDYSGNGVIKKATVRVKKEQTTSFSIEDSDLFLTGNSTVNNLRTSGRSFLYYDGETTVRNIEGTDGSTLRIYKRRKPGEGSTVKLTGTADKITVYIGSGTAELGSSFRCANGGKIISTLGKDNAEGTVTGAAVFNYSSEPFFSDGIGGPVLLGPDNITAVEPDSIPAVSFHMNIFHNNAGYYRTYENVYDDQDYDMLDDFDATKTSEPGVISYVDLLNRYFPAGSELPGNAEGVVFEVFSCKAGRVSMTILGSSENLETEWSTSADSVFLIRMAFYMTDEDSHGGSSATSTLSDRTGAGTIGGNPKSILTGTGIRRTVDPIDPDDPDDPDPVRPDPDDPDDPDPIRPDPDDPDDPDPVRPDPDDPDDPDPVRPDPDMPDDHNDAIPVTVYTSPGNGMRLMIDIIRSDDPEKAPYYVLSAYQNGTAVRELENPVKVIMDYELPEAFRGKQLYAVFAEQDESSDEQLKAYRAEYNEENRQLSFETEQLGEFVIAALDFDGEEFSHEFYDELGRTEEVQPLIELLKEKNADAEL